MAVTVRLPGTLSVAPSATTHVPAVRACWTLYCATWAVNVPVSTSTA